MPSPRLARLLLGMLALHANKVISVQSVRYALWAGRPPKSAAANLRGYLAELRRLVARGSHSPISIDAHPGGYCLHSGVDGVDLLLFEMLATQGRTLLSRGDHAGASERLTRALALWRGPAFAGDLVPESLQPMVQALDMKRQDTVEDAIEARLALGEHRELACELTVLVAQWPLRERLAQQLMLALCRSGRRVEALNAYHELRRQLADELGVAPSAGVQRLYQRVLEADPSLESHPLAC
jgi:DNA-binding SARP family transcriptional activator